MKTEQIKQTTILHVAGGTSPGDAAEMVTGLLAAEPRIAWCEPTPTKSRLADFPGLWIGQCGDLAERLASSPVAVDEARLFWPDSSGIHIVAGRGGTRWAAFWERQAPAWLATCPSRVDHPDFTDVYVSSGDVLTMFDTHRYGLLAPAPWAGQALKVREYREGGRLLWWRLEE